MAQFSRFVLCQRRPGDGHTTGVLVLSGMNGKPLFCLQRVSIQPRAQYFSGDVIEAGKGGVRKEEFNGGTDGKVWTRRQTSKVAQFIEPLPFACRLTRFVKQISVNKSQTIDSGHRLV